jgi:hypothetical protein
MLSGATPRHGAGARGRRILNDALGDGFERFLLEACVSIIAHTAGTIYMCMSSRPLSAGPRGLNGFYSGKMPHAFGCGHGAPTLSAEGEPASR